MYTGPGIKTLKARQGQKNKNDLGPRHKGNPPPPPGANYSIDFRLELGDGDFGHTKSRLKQAEVLLKHAKFCSAGRKPEEFFFPRIVSRV